MGTANFWLGPPLIMPLKWGTQLIFKIYLRDHDRQLEYTNQYNNRKLLQVFTSALYLLLTEQTSSKLLPKIIYGQVHMG